jgi:hypothetical protein
MVFIRPVSPVGFLLLLLLLIPLYPISSSSVFLEE